jgi:signal transduction histidine kinase
MQYRIENDTKSRLVDEQIHNQVESTKKISRHISSDLDSIVLALHGLANSAYIQQGDLSSENTENLMQEVYSQLNAFTIVDRLIILDDDNIATMFIVPEEQNDPYFGSGNISFEQLVNQTRKTLRPEFTDGFRDMDGTYRMALTYPILSRQTGEYIGSISALMPTVKFFEHYGNVHDIETQYLVAFDSNATFLTHPIKQNIGKDFFDKDFQEFIKNNKAYNDQIRRVILSSSSSPPQSLSSSRENEELPEPSHAIYNYGTGERLSTGSSILAQAEPAYFVFLVTPTSTIYSEVDKALFLERIGMFSLLAGTTVAIALLMVFLLRWNRNLNREVKRRTRELEDSNKELGLANDQLSLQDKMQKDFVNIAAHELRTPLQPIMSYSNLALNDQIDKVEALRTIDRQANKLQKLATDLLAISRIEGGRLSYRMEKIRINELILDLMRDTATSIGAKLKVNVFYATRNDVNNTNNTNNNDRNNWNNGNNGNSNFNSNKNPVYQNSVEKKEEDRDYSKFDNEYDSNYDKSHNNDGNDDDNNNRKQISLVKAVEERKEEDKTGQQGDKKNGEEIPSKEEEKGRRLAIKADLDYSIKEIDADKDRISQVLSNVIDNAVKFTTEGSIKVETRLVISDRQNSENSSYVNNTNKIQINISDSGTGIPEELFSRLFDKFATRSISTGKRYSQGTGLGLFIAKSIIKAHDGEIKAYNNQMGGATFSILLPVNNNIG